MDPETIRRLQLKIANEFAEYRPDEICEFSTLGHAYNEFGYEIWS